MCHQKPGIRGKPRSLSVQLLQSTRRNRTFHASINIAVRASILLFRFRAHEYQPVQDSCRDRIRAQAVQLSEGIQGKRAVVDRTWQFLRETPGVIGSWLMQRPQPLTQEEVDVILSTKPMQAADRPRPQIEFSVGETVKIKDGAFMGLTGQISMVDPDKGKLKVEVNVFSRKVPVDVDYWQVDKVAPEELAAAPQA